MLIWFFVELGMNVEFMGVVGEFVCMCGSVMAEWVGSLGKVGRLKFAFEVLDGLERRDLALEHRGLSIRSVAVESVLFL